MDMDSFYDKDKDGEYINNIYYHLLKQHRIIFLYEEIDSDVANRTIASLLYLDKQNKKEICIYINSIGGDALSGLAIYDIMQIITSTIKTVCVGKAYSAASDLLAAGTFGKRFATPNSEIMIHSIQAELFGSNKDIKEEVVRLEKSYNRSVELLSKHTGQSFDRISKDCEKDTYMTAQEALEYGIVDKILLPTTKRLSSKIKRTKTKRA